MAEYIEREALYEKAYWHGEHPDIDNPFPDGVDAIDTKDVDAIPAEDVAPVRHGRWIMRGGKFRCSECDARANWKKEGGTGGFSYEYEQVKSHYCHNCGAKMDADW